MDEPPAKRQRLTPEPSAEDAAIDSDDDGILADEAWAGLGGPDAMDEDEGVIRVVKGADSVGIDVDELTGLIGAAVIMRPSKSVMDFEVKSLKKKFKDKRFAAGCNRDVIRQGAELCGMELDELFSRTIDAMKAIAPDRDTFGK